MTEAPSVFDSGSSWERPRIIVRIKRSRLGNEFSKRLWKKYGGVGTIAKNRSAEIKGQDYPKIGEQQVDRAKFGGSSESNSDLNHDDSDGDDVGSIDSNEMASKTTHFKKTLIRIHRNAARECKSSKDSSASDSDAPYASEDEGMSVDHEEDSNDPRTDDENANDDMSSDQQEETTSLCESISSNTASNVSGNSSNVDPNMFDSKPKIMVLDNTIIASPSRRSSTSSLPDQSIKSPLLEQNKSPTVGKHILPTVFIPQQQNSRVAVPLNHTTKSNPQPPKDKPNMEENLNPNYPNITVEIDTSNDNVKINRIIEQKPPSSIKGTVRRKSTIPVRRKYPMEDENQRKEIIFNKEMTDVLQELEEKSNIRQSGLELLSSVCATTRPAPQLTENVGHQLDLDKMNARTTQIADVTSNGRHTQCPPIYNRSKSMPSIGISRNTPKDPAEQTIKIPDNIPGKNDVNSVKKGGNQQPLEDLTSIENSQKVVPPNETNSTRVPPMHPNQMHRSPTANWPVENIQINIDPISQSSKPVKGAPPEYKRFFSHQSSVTIPNPSLFKPYTRSVSSPSQYRNVENDHVNRIIKETNPHPVLQPHERFNHPTYIPDWHQQMLMSSNLVGNVMIPTNNISTMSQMKVNATVADASTERIGPGRRHSPPQNDQIRKNTTDINPVRYPSPYFNPVPMHYPLPHPMFYNPPYTLPHPMVVPKTPEENDQANMLAREINQRLFAQIQNQQLQQNLIMSRTTMENNQIRNENYQNMLAIYNTQTTVVSSHKALLPEDLTVECVTEAEQIPPPPYYSTHLVFDDFGEIIKEQSAIEISIIPRAELTYDQKQGKKAIEMMQTSPKQPHKEELPKSSPSNTGKLHNITSTTSADNQLRNKLQNDFLKKIQVFQKNLSSEQITIAFPKISYSNDFRLYPHIMQQLQDARVNAAKNPLTSSTTSGIYQPPPSPAYPLNSELLENLLQNEKPPLEKHHTNQSKPKTKTTSSSKNEIDKNQICTLYYESQDGKGQPECTKQTIIFTETSTTEANLQSEVASSKNPLLRNMENYNTLVKLIDSLASTEYDRLLGRTLLQYYPNEVLEITMNRMQKQMSSDENVLHILRKAKQSNKRVGTKEAPEPAVMLPEVVLNTSKLTVKTPELAVKTLELIPGTEETPIIPELVPKTLEALEFLPKIAESMSKTPESILETASRGSEVTESTSEVPGSPSKLPSKSPELNIGSNGCDRHMENLQNNETSKQLKGIPSSVIKQNPFAITTTKKVQDFACSSPPTIQSREDSVNHGNIEKSKLFTIKNQITSHTSSTEDNSKKHYEITLENEDIEDINIQNDGNSAKQGNSRFSTEDLTKNIDGNAKIGKVKSSHQDSTNRNTYQSVIVTPDPTTTIQNKMDEGYSKEEQPAVSRVNVIKDLLVKEKGTDEPEALDTVDRQSIENIGEEAMSGETIGSLDNISSTNHSSAFENTPEEPFAVLAIKDCSKEVTKEGSTSKEINSITATELPKPCNHGRPVPNNSGEKEIDENCNKQIESNTLKDSMKNHVICDISTGFYIESAKSAATASLESSIEAVAIQEAIQEDNETHSGTSSEKTPRQDGASINFETSDTSPENSEPASNSDVGLLSQTPSEEVDAQTDSTDEEVKEFELKREAFHNETKYLSHNFLFDIKIGPNDDIESIYARIMPSCFMILNLIHEMQNINSEANWWPVDSSGNLVKIKRSLRGISIFLKRSKKLATHLDTRIHHFFIFLLQCFGTFRERVRRILDNGYALKENYISTSEADIYRDVFIQLYDYLSCTRVTDYANIVIKREESMKKTKSNQTNSYQPTKPFPNVHQKYMFIIKQIKQRRDAEEEKNEDYKNFISHLLDNSQGLFEDDMNNNANIDDVIIIPDTEEVGTNAQNEPTPTTSIQRKRKVDFIVIDSDSDEDTRRSQENFPALKKHKLRKNTNHAIANIINLVDEEEDTSTSKENINQVNNSNNSSNKRQSSGEYSEINKRICSGQELETPTNVKNQNEVQIFPNFPENEHPNEIIEHMNETELKESKKQMEISQEFNKSLSSLRPDSDRKEIKFEDGHSLMVFQQNHEDCTNSNVKNSPIFQNGSIDGLENQVTPELRMEVECAQEAKHIPNQSGNCVPDISELNAIEKSAVKSNSPLNAENREGSETIEAIQNYLRETDLNFQEIHSANAENGEETSSSTIRQVNIGTNSEARVIGVAMPNVKDIRCPIDAKPISISSDNSVVECPKIISYSNEQNNDNDVKSIRDNLNKNLTSESLKDKSDGTITQRLMNFRKPAKKQTNTLDIHSSKAPGNLEPPNRSPEPNHCLNLTLNNNKMLQHHEHATLQDLRNVEIKLTESGKNPSPKPENLHIPLESQPFQTIPNSKITPRDPRSKPPERPPLQIKARRISLETQGNDLIPNGRSHLNTQQAEDCDYLNTQAKAAISEYFDAQKIVARQIANPIQADAAIREFDSFRSPAPPEISKYKQIHPIKAPLAVPPPQSPQPLLPPPNSSKERLRQAVTKRQLSQMQQPAQTQPRSAPTPIPTLQSIYNDNIDTRGFISQYIKDEIGVLSKKESLGPGEYVVEVNTLKRLPLIPRDFKEFYIFVTKQQILQLHQPIAFYIFLELLNQSGLKDYHKKFTEYSKRKYEDRVNLKKREQTHHQHRHLQHQQQQQQQLRHRT